MSEKSSSSSSSGIGCGGLLAVLLTVLFVGLKLTGNIAWSWVWVVSPIWIYVLVAVGLLVTVFGGIALIAGVIGLVSTLVKRHDRKKIEKTREKARFAQARPLGMFDSVGEKVKERRPHSWML